MLSKVDPQVSNCVDVKVLKFAVLRGEFSGERDLRDDENMRQNKQDVKKKWNEKIKANVDKMKDNTADHSTKLIYVTFQLTSNENRSLPTTKLLRLGYIEWKTRKGIMSIYYVDQCLESLGLRTIFISPSPPSKKKVQIGGGLQKFHG